MTNSEALDLIMDMVPCVHPANKVVQQIIPLLRGHVDDTIIYRFCDAILSDWKGPEL